MNLIPSRNQLPVFEVDPNAIEIIQTPADFYNHIKDGIRKSKKHILLASLYIGTSEQEIVDLLSSRLKEQRDLKVTVLLDFFRGTRMDSLGNSSQTLFHDLAKDYSDRVSVSFYHSPNVGQAIKTIVPPRFIEGFGLQHMKCYGFDDEIIISGANLNQDYFNNRQDRYVLVKSGKMATYFGDLVGLISGFSFKLSGSTLLAPPKFDLRQWANNKTFKHDFHHSIASFTSKWYQDTHSQRQELDTEMNEAKAYIAPTIQLFPLGIRQDEFAISSLLATGMKQPKYHYHILAGYFNLPNIFTRLMMSSKADFNLITSAPEANGFYGSRGVSRFIPDAYSYLETLFLTKVQRHKRTEGIKMFEYKRNGWTWHSKGIWMYSDTGEFATVVGSSNMNYRSLRRDLECQMIIFTKNSTLKKRFHDNLSYLYKDSSFVDLESVSHRKIPYTLRLVTRAIRNML